MNIQNMKSFYKTLGSNTKLIIRSTLVTCIWLIIFAITANYAMHYELLLEIDGILSATRSVIFIGLIGALISHRLEIQS